MNILVDPEDIHILASCVWRIGTHGYLRAGHNRLLHREILGAKPEQLVDHINGDKLDNRRANLRICDRSQSNCNRRSRRDSKAPYKGITKPKKGRWVAQIMHNKRFEWLGTFDTPEEAARAYDAAAIRLHGEFARINGV